MIKGFEYLKDIDPSNFQLDGLLTYLDSNLLKLRQSKCKKYFSHIKPLNLRVSG